jgi:histidine triad (HIT) family protein
MNACIFCQISTGQLPAAIEYEDDQIVAFRDIHPQAPVHILIIPRKHIATTNDLTPEDAELVGKMVLVARGLAERIGFAERGYRLTFNCNRDGGQAVYHLHLHLMGGRAMSWPPG